MAIGVIHDFFVACVLALIPFIASLVLSHYSDRQGEMKGSMEEYIKRYNPFKPFSIKKLILWYVCDIWFIQILAVMLGDFIGNFIRGKRG